MKAETQGEHTCPLCWSWFDTKTGLSNHVRGHLKRIGRCVTSTSKSPLCILNDLLQDEKEHQNILRVLNKGQIPPQPSASPKFISSSSLVLMHTALPVKIEYEIRSPHAKGDRFVPKQEAKAFQEGEKLQAETQRGIQASSSTLVELLQTRQGSLELTARNQEVLWYDQRLQGGNELDSRYVVPYFEHYSNFMAEQVLLSISVVLYTYTVTCIHPKHLRQVPSLVLSTCVMFKV